MTTGTPAGGAPRVITVPEPPASPTPSPLSLSAFSPSTPPVLTTHQPKDLSSPPFLLPPSNQPDALAPGVRRGPVNVAGNEAGEWLGLNGNLNAEAGSSC